MHGPPPPAFALASASSWRDIFLFHYIRNSHSSFKSQQQSCLNRVDFADIHSFPQLAQEERYLCLCPNIYTLLNSITHPKSSDDFSLVIEKTIHIFILVVKPPTILPSLPSQLHLISPIKWNPPATLLHPELFSPLSELASCHFFHWDRLLPCSLLMSISGLSLNPNQSPHSAPSALWHLRRSSGNI